MPFLPKTSAVSLRALGLPTASGGIGSREMGNAIYAAASQLLARGSPVIAGILVARVFSTGEFAAFSFFALTLSTFSVYAGLGLSLSSAKLFALNENGSTKENYDILALWVVSAAAIVISVCIAALVADTILRDFPLLNTRFLLVGIVAVGLGVVPSGAIQGQERFRAGFFAASWSAILMISVVVMAERVGRFELAVAGLIAAFALKAAFEGIATTTGRHFFPAHGRFDKVLLVRSIGSVARMALPVAATGLIASSGTWALGWSQLALGGREQFALFAIGMHWYAIGLLAPMTLARVAFASQVRSLDAGTSAGNLKARRTVVYGVCFSLFIGLLALALGAVFRSWLIALYGADFEQYENLIPAFLTASVTGAAAGFIGNALVACGRSSTWTALYFVWVVLVLTVAVFLSRTNELAGGYALSVGNLWLLTGGGLKLWREFKLRDAADGNIRASTTQNSEKV